MPLKKFILNIYIILLADFIQFEFLKTQSIIFNSYIYDQISNAPFTSHNK